MKPFCDAVTATSTLALFALGFDWLRWTGTITFAALLALAATVAIDERAAFPVPGRARWHRRLPDQLHASVRGIAAAGAAVYLLLLPPLPHPEIRMSMLLSQALSKRMPAANLPKGLKVAKLAAKDLERIKEYWLKREVRSNASWERFLKTYDTTRSFSVDPRSKGVELPLSIKANARENILLLFRTGELRRVAPGVLATLTLMQTTTRRKLVGGSTFVCKAAKLR